MKIYLVALALALFSGAVSGQEQDRCMSYEINVLPLGEVKENFKKSIKDLSIMHNTDNTLGATHTTYYASVNLVEHQHCVINVGYKFTTVFVAKEIARNDCTRNHIYDHEQEHVRFYREHLLVMEDVIRGKLGEAPTRDFAQMVSSYVVNSVKFRHRQLDNSNEYRRNITVCNGRINDLLQRMSSN